VHIVPARVSANKASPTVVPELVHDIRNTLAGLALGDADVSREVGPLRSSSAVDPRRSVFADHVVCLECGRKMTSLRRHLKSAHGLTPERYRANRGLPPTYPMVAPDYAERRSTMAKASGLGRR
jgi:predicted transcriptional regulator